MNSYAIKLGMARASILTVEPIGLGGIPTMASATYALLEAAGNQPHLVFVDQESVPTNGRRALLAYYRRHWRPGWEIRRGMRGLSIPLYPLPQWAGWYVPALAAPRALATDIRVVVAGSAHLGLPHTLSRAPFVLWTATRYADELHGRARVGDAWAQKVLEGPQWPRIQAQEGMVLRRAARVIALSPHTAKRILEDYPEVETRLDTVLCPVDMDVFRPPTDAIANPVGAPFLLLTARILDPRKNVSMLLDAFAQVRSVRPELKLVIVGDPPRPVDAVKCEQLGLNEAVLFMPPKSHAELVPYYQSAELFVLASTQEGLAISMLEALACGLPVIATRCGGPEGVIQDGRIGRLASNDDADAYASAILETLADPARLAAMRSAAAAYARETFAWPTISRQLTQSLRAVYPKHFGA